MRGTVVVTNDDGAEAPGLAALREVVGRRARVVVVAPAHHLSNASHSVTNHRILHLDERSVDYYVVDGTPADCVRIALTRIVHHPAWVMAGINEGANLGADVHMSGTVAAAREAALSGVPAMAVSHYVAANRTINWRVAANRLEAVLELILAMPRRKCVWNVNLPHPPVDSGQECPIVFRRLDPNPLNIRFAAADGGLRFVEDYHSRQREAGGDVQACFDGKIVVTPIPVVPSVDLRGLRSGIRRDGRDKHRSER